MLQTHPASHQRPHFQPQSPPDAPQGGELPVIEQEALLQCALFRRMLASPDFMEVMRWAQGYTLDKVITVPVAAEGRDRERLVALSKWEFMGKEMLKEMEDFAAGTERAMQERADKIKAQKAGTGEASRPLD